MGPKEKELRDRYSILCAELGDVATKVRLASKRQGEIEREIDGLNAAMPGAISADRGAGSKPTPSFDAPGEPGDNE